MARTFLIAVAFVAISTAVPAQAPEPPIADTRLTVHTLVREDIFAGFLQNDLVRLARAEKNIELLLASRPDARPGLLAWQGGTALTRAVNVRTKPSNRTSSSSSIGVRRLSLPRR